MTVKLSTNPFGVQHPSKLQSNFTNTKLKKVIMEYTNIIHNGIGYINVFNNGNLGLPMIANIPMENEAKVLALYGNKPNFTIEYCGCRYIMNWVVGKEPNYYKY